VEYDVPMERPRAKGSGPLVARNVRSSSFVSLEVGPPIERF